jgi:hypothetical protein
MSEPTSRDRSRLSKWGILFVRHGIGWILVVAGIVLLIVSPGGFGVEGFGMATGSGLSVLAINYLYRLGVSGDDERRRDEEARIYLAEHGYWPDQAPPAESQPPAGAPGSPASAGSAGPTDSEQPSEAAHDHRDPDRQQHRDAGSAGDPEHGGRRTGLGLGRGSRHRRR